MLTRIYPFDREMNLRTHFHFNSFPGHSPRTATQREWEKRNMKVTKNTERTHPPILNQPPRAPIQPPRRPTQPPRRPIQCPDRRSSHRDVRPSHRELQSSHRDIRPSHPDIQSSTQTSDPATEMSDLATQTSDPVLRPPIQPPRAPSPKRDCLQREWINWTHCSDHRAKHLSRWVFRHRFTGPISTFYIYIFIYLYIY